MNDQLEESRVKALETLYADAIRRSRNSADRLAAVADVLDGVTADMHGTDSFAKTVQADVHEATTFQCAASSNVSAYYEAKDTVHQIADLALLLASRQRQHVQTLTVQLDVLRASGYQP